MRVLKSTIFKGVGGGKERDGNWHNTVISKKQTHSLLKNVISRNLF